MNRKPQEEQGMWGCKGEDHMIGIGKALGGCGGWSGKKADWLKRDEETNWNKLRGMGID